MTSTCWTPAEGMELAGTWCDGYVHLIARGRTVCDVETLANYTAGLRDSILYGDDDGFVVRTVYGSWVVIVDRDDLTGADALINRLCREAIAAS